MTSIYIATYAGGVEAEEIVLLRADDPSHFQLTMRVGAAWSGSRIGSKRPWVCFALSTDAYFSVIHDAKTLASRNVDDQAQATNAYDLPLSHCGLTAVAIGVHDQPTAVNLTAEPPAFDGDFIHCVERATRNRGFDCNSVCPRDDVLQANVTYGTGDSGREMVLGWDDLYDSAAWAGLRAAEIVYMDLHPNFICYSNARLRDLACITSDARDDMANHHIECDRSGNDP